MNVQSALAQAEERLGVELTPVDELPGSNRAAVTRLRDGTRRSYVLKTFGAAAGEGWIRESAALATLRGRGLPVPELIDAGGEPPWVLMQDLGTGSHLADALLKDDAAEAKTALLAWADALAALHSGTVGDRELFARNLADRSGDLPADVDTAPPALGDAAQGLVPVMAELGLGNSAAAMDELRNVHEMLGQEHALSPADTCPDNNLRTSNGMKLLDFEGATFRHIAWDAAYLTVPWPSCWCSWRLPDEVSEAALRAWRAGVATAFPAASPRATHLDQKIEMARTAWAFISANYFLGAALGADPPPSSGRLAGLVPSRRAMIQHRLTGVVSKPVAELPELCNMAERLLAVLTDRWGATPLELAPAFRPAKEK